MGAKPDQSRPAGTKDEEWFFVLSVAIEAKGAQLIELMLDAMHGANIDDSQRIVSRLEQLNYGLKELGDLLERMYENCAPPVFYHQLRPYLAGSKNMASAGLPNLIFYDIREGRGEWHQYSGSNNTPPCISRPFIEVSNHLELPPCATYAVLNLWNFSVPSADTDVTDPDNLSVVTSFTAKKKNIQQKGFAGGHPPNY
ncbi:hypothetical protein ABZX51_007405 [Aspergillus tubingensis]